MIYNQIKDNLGHKRLLWPQQKLLVATLPILIFFSKKANNFLISWLFYLCHEAKSDITVLTVNASISLSDYTYNVM